MCRIFLAVGIGFYAYKRGILNQEVNEKLSALIVKVLAPIVILNSVSSVPHEQPELVWKLFVCGITMYLAFPVLAWMITGMLRVPSNLKGTCMCMLIFPNASFMGFPIVEALYGSSAIFYMTIFNMPFNFLFYTLALYLIRKDAERSDCRTCGHAIQETRPGWSAGREKLLQLVKICINPGMLSSAAALILYFLQIPLPEIFCTSAEFAGDAMTPMSMIIIGSSLAASSFSEIKTEKTAWLILPIRLLILPAIVWLAIRQLTSDTMLAAIATLSAAMPVGTMVSIVSVPHPRQNKLASIGVAMSTMFSLITIPFLTAVLGLC